MSQLRSPRRIAASDLPSAVPGVWHADSLGAGLQQTQPSGYAQLDEQLPGGGWPVGALSEVLQPLAGLHEWQLVLPALAQAVAARAGAVVGVAPPYEPFGPVLQARGLAAHRLCLVQADGASALWAAEQALRCRDVLAVMAWLPQVQPAALRRLQLAAAQQQQLLWVFRPLAAAPQASPALLRLQVQTTTSTTSTTAHAPASQRPPLQIVAQLADDRADVRTGNAASAFPSMQVQILKRRGPPMTQGLSLPGCHPRLAHELEAQAARRQALHEAAQAMAAGPSSQAGPGLRSADVARNAPQAAAWPEGRGHALDRAATAAVQR